MKYPEIRHPNQIEPKQTEERPKAYWSKIPVPTVISIKIDLNKIYFDPYEVPKSQPLYTYTMQLEHALQKLIQTTNDMIPEKEIKTLQDIKDWIESKEQEKVDIDKIATANQNTYKKGELK